MEDVIATAAIMATGLADLPEHLERRGPRRPEGDDWRPLSLYKVRNCTSSECLSCVRAIACAPGKYWESAERVSIATRNVMAMKCVPAKKAVARLPDTHDPANNLLLP